MTSAMEWQGKSQKSQLIDSNANRLSIAYAWAGSKQQDQNSVSYRRDVKKKERIVNKQDFW